MGTADRGRAGDEENKNLDIEGKSRVRLIGKRFAGMETLRGRSQAMTLMYGQC